MRQERSFLSWLWGCQFVAIIVDAISFATTGTAVAAATAAATPATATTASATGTPEELRVHIAVSVWGKFEHADAVLNFHNASLTIFVVARCVRASTGLGAWILIVNEGARPN
ncbi:hypothetical protein ACK1U3_01830 [Pseudomonas promysalinigenes]|uniref:hypothetical protein n=1 Tax=Pseudomonas promysalinigenes TaxID=485898 RepID=UPI003916EEAA